MQKHKICSFFGHRNVVPSEELKSKIKDKVEELINNDNVLTFLFGSRSRFEYAKQKKKAIFNLI